MAKVRGSKEELNRDSSTMSDQKSNELHKQKIARICDCFPEMAKDVISKILAFYDNEESEAVDAIMRDGGTEALVCFREPSSSKNKNKNKKKKKKGKKDTLSAVSSTASFDADDSSSLHSSGNVDADVDKDSPSSEHSNGVSDLVPDPINHQNPENDVPLSNTVIDAISLDTKPEQDAMTVSERIEPTATNLNVQSSSHDKTSDKSDDPIHKKEKFKSIAEHHKHNRQRTNSFRRSKSSSISVDEDVSSHNSQAPAAPTTRGFDKCKKDLSRQASALQRIHSQLDKQFDESDKKMKSVFADLQKQLENRQKELELEFSKAKISAFELLKSRQDLAVNLKVRIERAHALSDAEWSELRSDVKQFVTERRYDDELGKMVWFHWADISETIKSLGEIPPVKNMYSQRSHSGLSNASSATNQQTSPLPNTETSSVTNEEAKSPVETNESHTPGTVHEETHPVPKEEVMSHSHKAPHQNSRIFLPSRGGHPRSGGPPSRGYPNVAHRGGPNFSHPYRGNSNYKGNNPKPHYYDENRNFNSNYRGGGPPPYEGYGDRNNYNPRGGNRRGFRGRSFSGAPRHQNNRHHEGFHGAPRHQEGFNSAPRHHENAGAPRHENATAPRHENANAPRHENANSAAPRHHENAGAPRHENANSAAPRHHENVNTAPRHENANAPRHHENANNAAPKHENVNSAPRHQDNVNSNPPKYQDTSNVPPRHQDGVAPSHKESTKAEPQAAGVVNGFAD